MVKIIRKRQQKNRLHHYRSQIVQLKTDAARWRFLEHGCQWVSFTPSGGETRSFDPRIVSGYAGHLQDMRATVDAELAKQLALLKEGAENLKRKLA